ncbi:MAG: LanC-like protein [Burkholderiales bacterium]|nr:LanC-like protein [Burkholderiales bacterium]
MTPLWQPGRHEPLQATAWNEGRAREAIERIGRTTEDDFARGGLWTAHPRSSGKQGPHYMLYAGACGTIWALHYLAARGAVTLANGYAPHVLPLLRPNRGDFGESGAPPFGSYLMGDTSILMLQHLLAGGCEDGIAGLIEANMDHPTRELMWGAPGTLLAALLMHRHTGEARFADLFRRTAAHLWGQLAWSDEHQCHYWTQDMYGERSDFLDAVHGFIGTAAPLVAGRDLLPPGRWADWQACIANTTRRNAEHAGGLVNWRARLSEPRGNAWRMQFCHGSPGFVVCLGDWPDDSLDDLLAGGAEAAWQAGPLAKGPQLCHGTAGNGYAFLKLWRRTGNPLWLERARAFAMHGIFQYEREVQQHGRLWHSLWTGHLGFAVYLLDCVEATDRFPTLDIFYT